MREGQKVVLGLLGLVFVANVVSFFPRSHSGSSSNNYGSNVAQSTSSYYDSHQSKVIPDNTGKSCSFGGTLSGGTAASVCGFGAVCLNGNCVSDYSQPMFLLRDATDQGPCDSAGLISAVHEFDDRKLAHKTSSENMLSSDYRLNSKELTSIRHVRDCSSGSGAGQWNKRKYNLPGLEKFEDTNIFGYGSSEGCNGATTVQGYRFVSTQKRASEYNVPYNSSNMQCSEASKYAELVYTGSQLSEKCMLSSKDVKIELKRGGPFAHDIYVHDELFKYPFRSSSGETIDVIRERPEIFGVRDERRGQREGLTSVVIAGFSGDYFLLKFPWGKSYGLNGYVKIEETLLFDRYMAKCGSINRSYRWKDESNFAYATSGASFGSPISVNVNKKYPVMSYVSQRWSSRCGSSESTEYKSVCIALGMNFADRARGSGSDSSFNANVVEIDSKTNLAAKDKEDEMPQLRAALRAAMETVKTKTSTSNYHYKLESIVSAKMVIVSGRKYSLILELRRGPKGRVIESSFDYYDNDKNIRNGWEKDPVYYEFEVWLPLDQSEVASKYYVQTLGSSWFGGAPSQRYVVVKDAILLTTSTVTPVSIIPVVTNNVGNGGVLTFVGDVGVFGFSQLFGVFYFENQLQRLLFYFFVAWCGMMFVLNGFTIDLKATFKAPAKYLWIKFKGLAGLLGLNLDGGKKKK